MHHASVSVSADVDTSKVEQEVTTLRPARAATRRVEHSSQTENIRAIVQDGACWQPRNQFERRRRAPSNPGRVHRGDDSPRPSPQHRCRRAPRGVPAASASAAAATE